MLLTLNLNLPHSESVMNRTLAAAFVAMSENLARITGFTHCVESGFVFSI